jgi:L-lactate permease
MRETTLATKEMVKQMLTINRILEIANVLHKSGLAQDKAIRLASIGWNPSQRLN